MSSYDIFFALEMVQVGDRLNQNERRVTCEEYKGLPEKGTRLGWRGIEALGLLLPVLWFALVFAIARPLVNGPVADSWIYLRAIKRLTAGTMSLPGFTAATPLLQILYGAFWSRLFGLDYISLDWSVIVLAIAGGMLFYVLARRCNARPDAAALGTALLIFNPCYLFLGFSFMSDVPFVFLLIAAYLAFATAWTEKKNRRMWACAALLTAAFAVRVFAVAAIVGCAAVVWMSSPRGTAARRILPFVAVAIACALIWLTLTAFMPVPWMLELKANKFHYLGLVSIRAYFADALAAPLLYLGLVLSPLAVPRLITVRWGRGLAIAAALAVIILPLLLTDPGANSIPELSCCGSWSNVLVLRGPKRFLWTNDSLRLAVLAVAILGLAGTLMAAAEISTSNPGFWAVIVSTAIYWAGLVPLWFYNDRYYLVMVPAGCLLLALAPYRKRIPSAALTVLMLAGLGWFAAAGVYDQQRGLEAVMAIRDALVHQGVPRDAIDAGYPLNGSDLYRDPKPGEQETFALEAGIPLITTLKPKPYTISLTPMPDAEIVKRFQWPGVLGFGHRTLYLLKKNARPSSEIAADSLAEKRGTPRDTGLTSSPGLFVESARIAVMATLTIAPLLGVLVFLKTAGTGQK
jgi:hypothetical protein